MARSDPARPLLLDTHVWVWYVEGDRSRFSRTIEQPVEHAAARGAVLVSSISVWEIALLESLRRLDLRMDVRAWIGRALAFPGVRCKALSPAIAVESTRLPGPLHRDPADRMLVATARLTGAALVTGDERLIEYASHGHVRVIDARP